MKHQIILAFSACLLLAGCAKIEVYTKPESYTNGIIIRSLNKDVIVQKVLINNGECKMKLAAGPSIEKDGSSLVKHGVVYLPKMQECSESAGKLALEVKKGESNFDIITYDKCPIKSAQIQTNKGSFNFKTLPVATPVQINLWADESRLIRPWVDEPPRKELSPAELDAKARTCQPY